MEAIGKRIDTDPRLSEVVGHFYLITTPADYQPSHHYLSPSLEMMVVFNFSDPFSFSFAQAKADQRMIERVGIIGPIRQLIHYQVNPQADLLIIPFIYNGFYRFLSLSMGEQAHVLSEADLLKHIELLEALWEKLAAISHPEKRVEFLQAYLIDHITQTDERAFPLLAHVPAIHNPRVNPVQVMAGSTSLTERTIQLRFKKYVGYSLKELVRFLRFKQVVSSILRKNSQKIDWMQIASTFGYFDQSHLIKDFTYYTGVSPKEFLKLNETGNFCVSRD
jgi:AraC-like DNA-binding protein